MCRSFAPAEALPFRDETFDAAVGGDVIEHVGDAQKTIAEAHRVLRPGGRLFLATPNRHSLGLEPHVGVWGVGFLPRKWMPTYVRVVSGGDFRAIKTRSFLDWTRILASSPFRGGAIDAPALPETDLARFGRFKRGLAVCYNRVVACAAGRRLARRFGPLFHLIADRPIDSPTLQIAKSASVTGNARTNGPQTASIGATVANNRRTERRKSMEPTFPMSSAIIYSDL